MKTFVTAPKAKDYLFFIIHLSIKFGDSMLRIATSMSVNERQRETLIFPRDATSIKLNISSNPAVLPSEAYCLLMGKIQSEFQFFIKNQ